MIIDFHTHNFPDSLAPRAIAKMVEMTNNIVQPVGDGTLAMQLRDMTAAGVERAVMLPVATKPEQFEAILRRSLAVRDGALGETVARRIIPFASLHPADTELAAHIEAIVKAGLKGVKIHPFYQGFALDDPAVWPFFRAIRDAGLLLVSHCGYDPGYPGQSGVCGAKEVRKLLEAVPGLAPRFVAAHLGGYCGALEREVELLRDSECWLDTACVPYEQDKPEPRRIMATWPAERLLFATDYYWFSQPRLIAWVKALRPDPHEQELIFHANAERLLASVR